MLHRPTDKSGDISAARTDRSIPITVTRKTTVIEPSASPFLTVLARRAIRTGKVVGIEVSVQ
jgi:hypothetical protein